jgi:uncharacterized protein
MTASPGGSTAAPTVPGEVGAAGGTRLLVPDALRGAAILAMLIAHAVPFLPDAPSAANFVMYNVNDVASPLFALVMGMSAQLVAQRTAAHDRPRMLAQQAVRALVLVALGLWLVTWGSWVAVILGHLGVLLLVGAPLALLPTRWLGGLTVVTAVASSPLNAWARGALAGSVGDPDAPLSVLLRWVVLDSHYRLTNLLPFFLAGALLLRHGARRDRLLWGLLAVAPLAWLVAPTLQRLRPDADFVSGSHPDTLHDVGLVALAYVAVVLLATASRPAPFAGAVLGPLRALGTVALSLYVLHVGVLALWAPDGLRPSGNDYPGWLVIVPGMVLVGVLWARRVGAGPLEWLVGTLTGRRRRRRVAATTG